MTDTTTTESQLEKVRKILDKAQSTSFAPEAEALFAKAEELMTKWAIDQAMLQGLRGEDKGVPITVRIDLADPYRLQKATILNVVAKANGCLAVWTPKRQGRPGEGGYCQVVGYRSDLDNVELLFTSLSLHAMGEALKLTGFATAGKSMQARGNFLLGFATRVGERLEEARRAATKQAEAEHGSNVAVVLYDRNRAVNNAFKKEFPLVRSTRSDVRNGDAFRAGQAAANRADIGQRRIGGMRPALTA